MSENKDKKLSSENLFEGNENLEKFMGAVGDNIYDLNAYDGMIDTFQISPDKNLATTILEESNKLFSSDALELATNSDNLNLGIQDFHSDIINGNAIFAVNEGITNFANTSLHISESVAELNAVDASWINKYDPIQYGIDIDEINGIAKIPDLDIQSHEIVSDALFAESTYLNLDSVSENIGANFKIDPEEAIQNFSQSFSKFGDLIGINNEVSAAFSLENNLVVLSSKELFNSSSLLDQLSVNENFELPFYDEKLIHLDNEVQGSQDELEEMLEELNPKFLKMLRGAESALRSNNPDKIRHFGSSLRNLFTHVLHQLAPTQNVERWTDDDNHFHNGKPTRRARILYISRNVPSNSFQDFLHSDAKSVLSFISLFHGITHKVDSNYTNDQLRGMLTKMRGTLHLLITTSKV